MLQAPFILMALASLAHSACHSLDFLEGMTTAMCKDESTGNEFMYMDMDAKYPAPSKFRNDNKLLKTIYQDYLNGTELRPRHEEVQPEQSEQLTRYWKVCRDAVQGVCANDHVIKWTGTKAAWIMAVTGIVATVNHANRENSSPRSICNNYRSGGTICVSWSMYQTGRATDQQIKDVSNNCWDFCQSQNNSCESRVVQGSQDVTQYFCVSNRGVPTVSFNPFATTFLTKWAPV